MILETDRNYAFLTEEMRTQTLTSLENNRLALLKYGCPCEVISAIDIQKKIVERLPKGMIVPIK